MKLTSSTAMHRLTLFTTVLGDRVVPHVSLRVHLECQGTARVSLQIDDETSPNPKLVRNSHGQRPDDRVARRTFFLPISRGYWATQHSGKAPPSLKSSSDLGFHPFLLPYAGI